MSKKQEVGDWLGELADTHEERTCRSAARRRDIAVARDHAFLRAFVKIAGRTLQRSYVPPKGPARRSKKTKRILNLLLSDLHYGSLLDGRELPLSYGPIEEARRTAAIVAQAASYKLQHRSETTLNVHLLGDVIQGHLHDPRDAAPLAAQMCASIHILCQAIAFLAGEFKSVQVYCTPGNHGRNKLRHDERATTQKWDALETAIYYAVSKGVEAHKNVAFTIPKTPYYVARVFDRVGFFTHGDTVLKPGFPSRTINIHAIRNQINTWRASKDATQQYDLFGVGHVHTGSITHLPEGAIFMSNGALIPPDGFAVSVGVPQASCGQWLWESVPGHIVGDHRFVVVDRHIDLDRSLDRIITPYDGY